MRPGVDPDPEIEKLKRELSSIPVHETVGRRMIEMQIARLMDLKRLLGQGGITKPGVQPSSEQQPRREAHLIAHFGVVPVTIDMLRGLERIAVGFEQARTKYNSMGRPEMAKNLSAYEATYTKTFVERQKLPQAVELAKTGLDLGYQVIIASEQTGEDLFHRDRDGEPSEYQKLDDLMGGQLKRTLPNLPNVFDTLREEFGDKVGNYSGGDSPEREKVREEFLRGNLPLVYMSMKAGAIGTDWHDADYPELGIKGGDKPRLMIVLGPPYSGVLLEQLMGRPWRYGVKSNVHMVFLGTDAEPDIRLMQTKIGPRMRALRASVHGERDSLAAAMDNYSQEEKNRMRQDMLAYQEGDEAEVSTSEYKVRSKGTTAAIQNWSAIEFPLAQESKRKVPPSSRYALIEWQLRHQGTGGEVPWQDIDQLRLQLEQAKKELAKTPVWKTVARTILQMKIERLENEIRAKYGAETRPHEAQTEGIPGEEDCNPKPLTNLSEAVFHEAGFRIGEAPRPFKEGMRRLAIFGGLMGAVAGGFCAHKALHSIPSQRYQHRVFERLSALDIVKQRRAALISESARGANFDWPFATDISGPWAVAAPPPIDYDALAKKYGGVLQSSEPPQLTAPSGLRKPDPSFSASGIKTIYWKPDFTVDFFVMQDGGYVSSEPSPSAWLYLLWAAYPALGFAISWSLIRGLPGWWTDSARRRNSPLNSDSMLHGSGDQSDNEATVQEDPARPVRSQFALTGDSLLWSMPTCKHLLRSCYLCPKTGTVSCGCFLIRRYHRLGGHD
jgi:hypothetical protein